VPTLPRRTATNDTCHVGQPQQPGLAKRLIVWTSTKQNFKKSPFHFTVTSLRVQ